MPGPAGPQGPGGTGPQGAQGSQGGQGAQGTQGVQGAANTLNSLSPTTTRGDLIVDNGANNPLANDVRLGVGTDGKALVGDSSQPTGLSWKTIAPNTVATSGDIAIFDGTTGSPVPVKDSKLLITSDGAIQSTPSGGNARGTKATDLQIDRAAATQVASGTNSVLAGGQNNTASGTGSAVAGGDTNLASGVSSAVVGGNTNTASNLDTFVGGGTQNVASGSGSSVVAGAQNTVSATFGFIGGGSNNTNAGQYACIIGGIANQIQSGAPYSTVLGGTFGNAYLYGQIVHAQGIFAALANVEAFLDGPAGAERAVIPLNTSWAFCIYLCGRSSAGVGAAWKVEGAIQNIAGTVTLVAAVTKTVIADGTGGSWGVAGNFAVTADNTNKSLKLAVTGAGATNIRWVAHARIAELQF